MPPQAFQGAFSFSSYAEEMMWVLDATSLLKWGPPPEGSNLQGASQTQTAWQRQLEYSS